ncbi:MAG: magnesium-translocating P-type ATPase [Oscillospiraceae bacterium]|nr:magnesium-translocating P-type ATPase [Oscillospiraceae bacterium]
MSKRYEKLQKERLAKRRILEKDIMMASILTEDQLYTANLTSPVGFTEEQVEEIRDEKGENIIDYGKEKPIWLKFLSAFVNPFSIVLFIIVGVSLFTDVILAGSGERDWATIIIILSLIAAAGLLEFRQEYKADRDAKSLKNMVSAKTSVIREGAEKDIKVAEVVPGDLVVLAAGDMIPADMRILQAKDLFINESALTGESEPVEKFAEIKERAATVIETPNIAFMGTNVISGSAQGIIISTANDTYLGSIAHELTGTKAQTSFEKGIGSVSKFLLRLTLVMVPVILLINGLTKGDWLEALIFACAVAVGLAPELLPMITTSTLAKGAMFMAKQKVIVKNLNSIPSFGGMSLLCTDKTGTLTEDEIILERYLNIYGEEDMSVLTYAYLNSKFQTGLKSMIDVALIERAKKDGYEKCADFYRATDEIPWDFTRRRMSVVLSDEDDERTLITKGALEEILKCCSQVVYRGEIVALTDEAKKQALKVADGLNGEGLRLIAVAYKNDVEDVESFGVKDEDEMVLSGICAFLDPPKESAGEAIKALNEHGIEVKVLTGDNEKVTATVCERVGIGASPDKIMMGAEVEPLTDDQLKEAIQKKNIFAKLSPAQKAKIVRCFQELGHTVGFLGDGINDAPALRQADVGVSVDTGVDISKESADVILMEKDLMVLERGVLEGRRTFANLLKYLRLAVSGNFGNIFAIIVSAVYLPFLPMLPVMILVQNLLADFAQIPIPFDKVDTDDLKTPKKFDIKSIARFTYIFGPISSIFDVTVFVILWFVFAYDNPELQNGFQTGWFLFGILSQIIVFHFMRTKKIPFVQSRASLPLILSTVAVGAAALILPFTAVGAALGFAAPRVGYLGWLFCIIAVYAVITQIAKTIYVKIWKEWL